MNDLLRRSNLGNIGPADEAIPATDVARSDVDSSLKYFLIFMVLGVGGAIFLSYRLFLFTSAPSLATLLVVGVVASAMLIVIVFHSILIKSWQYSLVLALAESVALLTFFFGNFLGWYGLAATVFFVFWLMGFMRARKDLSERLIFDFKRYSLGILTMSSIGFALFLAIVYSGMYEQNRNISEPGYNLLFTTVVSPALKPFVTDLNQGMTVDAALQSYIRSRLSRESDFGLLNNEQKEAAIAQVAFELRNRIVQVTTIPVLAEETVGSYTHRLTAQWLSTMESRGLGTTIVIVMLALIFFAVRFILFIIKWPILFITILLYYLLVSFKVVSVQTDTRPKEVIIIQ